MRVVLSRLLLVILGFFLSAGSFFVSSSPALAIVPKIVHYQGRLYNASGVLLGSASGVNYFFKFSIWDNASVGLGTKLWPAGAASVQTLSVQNGVFNYDLGSTAPDSDLSAIDFQGKGDSLYLQIDVSSDNTTFETLSPRQRIVAQATALNADQLQGAAPGTGASNILKLNASGGLDLSSSNPTIQATALNSNLSLLANGTGSLVLGASTNTQIQFFGSSYTLSSSGSLTIGAVTGTGALTISAGGAGAQNLSLNAANSGNVILGASTTSQIQFFNSSNNISSSGNLTVVGGVNAASTALSSSVAASGGNVASVTQTNATTATANRSALSLSTLGATAAFDYLVYSAPFKVSYTGQTTIGSGSGVAPLVIPTSYASGATVSNLSAERLNGLPSSAFNQGVTAGNGVSITGALPTQTIAVSLVGSGSTTTTSSPSGLEFSGGNISLLRGCSDTQLLKWQSAGATWTCSNDLTTGGAASALSAITAATAFNSISNGDNAQVWNWSVTTASKSAFSFGESAASTGTNAILLNLQTLSASTASPFQVTAGGTANGVKVDTTGLLQAIGTGGIKATTLNGNTFAIPGAIGSTTPSTGAFTTLSAATSITDSGLTTAGVVTNTAAGLLGTLAGTTTTVLHGNAAGLPSFSAIVGGDLASNIIVSTTGNIATTATGTITSAGLLTASNGLTLSSGTLTLPAAAIADSALSSNIPLKNVANTFTNAQTIAPTQASVVGLTLKGTTGIAANVLEIFDSTATPTRQSYFDSGAALNTTKQITSTLVTGTAPFSVASTTTVANLSAASINGFTFSAPGTIGGTTPGAATFTTLTANTSITDSGLTTAGVVTNTAAGLLGTLPGTTTTVLHGNAAGAPSFGAIVNGDLTAGSFTNITGLGTLASLIISGGTNSILSATSTATGATDSVAITNSSQAAAGANAVNIAFKNNSAVSTGATNGLTITEQATTNATGNTANLINLVAATNGTVNAINVSSATGFTNYLKTPSIAIDSSGNITGAGTIGSGAITSTGAVQGTTLVSTVATGTAPLTVTSTTNVANLNASSLNGFTFAAPGTIGGTIPGSATFTTLTANTSVTDAGLTAAGIVTNSSAGLFGTLAGTTSTVLHGNAAGLPTYSSIVNNDLQAGSFANITGVGTLGALTVTSTAASGTVVSFTDTSFTADASKLFVATVNNASAAIGATAVSGLEFTLANGTNTNNSNTTNGINFPAAANTNSNTINGINFASATGFTNFFKTPLLAIASSGQIQSTVATGTAPFTVSSTTLVSNLNAALLNGKTFADPGAIGGTTPAAATFTTVTANTSVTDAGLTTAGVVTNTSAGLLGTLAGTTTTLLHGNAAGLPTYSSVVGGDLSAGINISTTGTIATTSTGTITSAGLLTASNGFTLSSGSLTLPNNSVADSALSTNVALLNSVQSFTAAKTFATATATDDTLSLTPFVGGVGRFNGSITSVDLTAARTYTLPNASGTFAVSASNPITLSAAGAIGLNTTSANDVDATTSNNSGLIVTTNGLGLLRGCSDQQILKYTSSSGVWSCAADNTGAGGTFVNFAPAAAQTDATTNNSIFINKTAGSNTVGLLNLTQAFAVTASFTGSDIALTRNITSATASVNNSGSLVAIANPSSFSGTSALNNPTGLLITNATPNTAGAALYTGNFVDFQRADAIGGAQVSKFSVSGTGNLTLVGNINAATASNTINGLVISSGALSSITTINASGQITSTLASGTAPFVVASSTNVANLNASSLNGKTFADSGPIGSTTASTGAFTTLSASTSVTDTGLTTAGVVTNTSGGLLGTLAGTTTTVLHGNAAGLPTFGAIVNGDLTSGTYSNITGVGTLGSLTVTGTVASNNGNLGAFNVTENLSATGTVNGLTLAPTLGGSAAVNTYTLNALNVANVAGTCPATASCINNGLQFGTGLTNYFTDAAGTTKLTSGGALTLASTISAATSSTINGISINAGAVSGVSTFGLSGAIAGATATNTINSLVINAGALSGITTISASGQITSTLATGTAPFSVASTTNVANLNASSLNGATFAAPGAIGSTTASSGVFTTLASTAATGLTLGTSSAAVGGLVLKNATNANTLTINSGVTGTSYTLTLPTGQGGASTFLQNDGAGVLSWAASASGCSTCIFEVPGTTAQNTIAPTAASVVALTVKGTTGTSARVAEFYDSTATPALQAYFDATGALNLNKALSAPTATNTINGLVINAGAISGGTGITSSGSITFSGLTTAGVTLNSATGLLSTLAGTTTTILHGNASGLPTFSSVVGGDLVANIAISTTGSIATTGSGTFSQTYANTVSGNASIYSVTNNSSAVGATTISGSDITLINGINANNSNTVNGITFEAATNTNANTINGISFLSATGFTNFFNSPLLKIASNGQIQSTVSTGTAPFTVSSTTTVANLTSANSTQLNGATFATPGTIGGTTPGAATFTTLTANTSITDGGLTAAGVTLNSATGLLSTLAGTTTTVLHGNAAGLPTFSSIVNNDLQSGSFANITGLGTLAALTVTSTATSGTIVGLTDTAFTADASKLLSATVTNASAAVGATAVSGLDLTLATGTNTNNSNTTNGINFPAATITNSNTINGINFASATGFTNFLKTPSFVLSSTGALSGVTTINASGQFTSTLATGTAPFSVASTTNVANLNASSLNGATFAAPGTIGGGTPGAATFTTLTANTSVTDAGLTTGGVVTNTSAGLLGTLAGTTTTVLHGNAGGLPSFGAIVNGDLTSGSYSAITGVGTLGSLTVTGTFASSLASLGAFNVTENLSATGTVNGVTLAPTLGGTAAANTYTLNALNIANVAGTCPVGATCVNNGALFGTGLTNYFTDAAATTKLTSGGALTLASTISANTTNTINSVSINAGAVSGVTTLGLSGAITGATATNTINGLVINSGALSGVTTITQSSSAATGNQISWSDVALTTGTLENVAFTNASALNAAQTATGLSITGNTATNGGNTTTLINLASGGTTGTVNGINFTNTNYTNPILYVNGANSTSLRFAAPTASNIITFPNAGGTVAVSASNPITLSAAGAIGLNTTSANDSNATTSNNSGLIVTTNGVGLLRGCADQQILKFTLSGGTWGCANDLTSAGGTPVNLDPVVAQTSTANNSIDINKTNAAGSYLNLNRTLTAAGAYSLNEAVLTRTVADGGFASTGSILKIIDSGTGTGAVSPDLLLINQANTSSGGVLGNLINAQLTGASKFSVSTAGLVTQSGNHVFSGAAPAISVSTAATALTISAGTTGTITLASGSTGNVGFFNVANNFITSAGALTLAGAITAPTTTNTINSLVINAGALSNITTLSMSGQLTSTLGTGTAPFSVASTTTVTNLSAGFLNGATFAAPGTIGGTTPGAATFTTLTANTSISTGGNITLTGASPTISSSNASALTISSAASQNIIFTPGSNVGIGTTTPGEKLEVVGNIISKGTSWTTQTSAADASWNSVAYGNGLYVAISGSCVSNTIKTAMTSTDGINWTIVNGSACAGSNPYNSVTYGNGIFVAVGSAAGAANQVITSPNGTTWTARTSATNANWNSVTYGSGTFVAVSSTAGTANQVMTSPDGISWTARTSSADQSWQAVTYGNGLFVAVSTSGTGTRVMTSPDGITWTTRTSAADASWNSVAYGNGLYVAISGSCVSNTIKTAMTSTDGINWTIVNGSGCAGNNTWNSVTYGNGLFVAVGSTTGTGNQVITSPNGTTWTARTSAADNSWQAVTYGNGTFSAVSTSGTSNRAMTSGKTDYAPFSPNNIYQGGMTIFGNLTQISTATSGDANAVTDSSFTAANSNLVNLTFKNNAASSTGAVNGLTVTEQATTNATGNTANLINLTAAAGGTVNGVNFGSNFTNYFTDSAGTTKLTSGGALTLASTISANTTNTINGVSINSSAISGVTTLGLSGAITGATATNTINGLIINSGSLSGVTGYTQGSGTLALTSATTTGVLTDTLTASTTTTNYTANDSVFTRNLTSTTGTQAGAVFKITDTSTANAGVSIAPDLLQINQAATTGTITGNLINAQLAGATKFKVDTTGAITAATSNITTAGGETLGTLGSINAKLVFNSSNAGNFATTINALATQGANITYNLPTAQGGGSTFLQNDGSGNLSWAAGGGGCSTCIWQVPGTTAQNTIIPTASAVVGLTIKGSTTANAKTLDIFDSSASPAEQLFVDATGVLTVNKPITAPTTTNTINGLIINSGALSGATSLTISGATNSVLAATSTATGSTDSVAITNSSQAAAGANAVNVIFKNNSVASTGATNGLTVTQQLTTNATGNTANLINLSATAGGTVNGLNYSGTLTNYTNLINAGASLTVTGAGAITAGSTYNSNTFTSTALTFGGTNDTITSTGTLTITPAGALTLGATGQTSLIQGSSMTENANSGNYTLQDAGNAFLLLTNATGALAINSLSTGALTLQSLTQTANASAAVTLQSGNTSTGTSINSGLVTIKSGNATGTTSTAGNVTIDVGTSTTGNGSILIGNANGDIVRTIGVGSGNATSAQTINIGTGATTGAQTITIGSVTTTNNSVLSLKASVGGATNNVGVLIGLGNGADTTPTLLTLDSGSTYTEVPTCSAAVNQGSIYYNSASNTIRACVNAVWSDVVTSNQLPMHLFGVELLSGATPGDWVSINGTGTGPCKVIIGSVTTAVRWTGCTAYSGGRAVVVPAQASDFAITLGNNKFVHLCLNGTNNAVAQSASGAENADLPTFSASKPVLCLATIKTSASAITEIYDDRTFTTDTHEPTNVITTGASPGIAVVQTTTAGEVTPTSTVAGVGLIRGVVVATDGSITAGTINAIITVAGPAYVKSTAGTASQFIENGTTAGYTITTATLPTTGYGTMGLALSSFSSTCSASTDLCRGSLAVDLRLR